MGVRGSVDGRLYSAAVAWTVVIKCTSSARHHLHVVESSNDWTG